MYKCKKISPKLEKVKVYYDTAWSSWGEQAHTVITSIKGRLLLEKLEGDILEIESPDARTRVPMIMNAEEAFRIYGRL